LFSPADRTIPVLLSSLYTMCAVWTLADLISPLVPERIKSLRQERLSSFRPLSEFFDHQRISRPQDTNEAFQRITYNTRHFSGNYAVLVALLTVYGIINDLLLLFSIFFLVVGFWAINRFAPEPMQVGEHVITQKSLYTGLFLFGIPLLWFASPFGFMFWLVGSSAFLILGHAAFIEPPVSSEYTGVEVSSFYHILLFMARSEPKDHTRFNKLTLPSCPDRCLAPCYASSPFKAS
jgi:hypothetical protein